MIAEARGIGKICGAIIVSAMVNILIFLAMGSFNCSGISASKRLPDITPILTLRDGFKKDGSEPCESEVPKPFLRLSPEPEIMTVNLDLPLARPIAIEPIELKISMPSISPCMVQKQIAKSVDFRQTASGPAVSVPLILSKTHTSSCLSNAQGTSVFKQSLSPPSTNCVDTPPKELDNPSPRYPQDALGRGIEGYVVVKFLIRKNGSVENIQIVQVEGHESFRQAVLAPSWEMAIYPRTP